MEDSLYEIESMRCIVESWLSGLLRHDATVLNLSQQLEALGLSNDLLVEGGELLAAQG